MIERGADHPPGGAPPGPARREPTSHFVVRVAPAVLATIVRRAAEQVEGVARIAGAPPGARRWRGGSSYARDGLRLSVHDGRIRVALNLVVARSQNLQAVGTAVQEAVASALQNLVGMGTESVDIYVQGVD